LDISPLPYYLRDKMPTGDSRERRIMELVDGALSFAGASRAVWLESACQGDSELLRAVQQAIGREPPACDLPRVDPEHIGGFEIVRRLGEGGMGVVYHARQTHPIRRDIALKIVRPGMDSRLMIARFESERQALAMMNHPNIARVLEAGATPTGSPYFVMGLVDGPAITHYCDASHLNIRNGANPIRFASGNRSITLRDSEFIWGPPSAECVLRFWRSRG
jgi:serine/threonine protein kinase